MWISSGWNAWDDLRRSTWSWTLESKLRYLWNSSFFYYIAGAWLGSAERAKSIVFWVFGELLEELLSSSMSYLFAPLSLFTSFLGVKSGIDFKLLLLWLVFSICLDGDCYMLENLAFSTDDPCSSSISELAPIFSSESSTWTLFLSFICSFSYFSDKTLELSSRNYTSVILGFSISESSESKYLITLLLLFSFDGSADLSKSRNWALNYFICSLTSESCDSDSREPESSSGLAMTVSFYYATELFHYFSYSSLTRLFISVSYFFILLWFSSIFNCGFLVYFVVSTLSFLLWFLWLWTKSISAELSEPLSFDNSSSRLSM